MNRPPASPILRTHGFPVGAATSRPQPSPLHCTYPFFLRVRSPLVGDGALDVPFRIPSMPVRKRRGGYQPPVSWDYDPALAGG